MVGLPGSGKSTIGKILSEHLNIPFKDLDQIISEEEGMPIPEIFSQKGETYFRELEAACLRRILDKADGKVLATGGGAPCFHNNMDVILQKGLSIYLEVPFEVLAERLFAEGVEKRPLLEGINQTDALVALLEQKFAYRLPFYEKAALYFHNSPGNSIEALVKEIQARIKKY